MSLIKGKNTKFEKRGYRYLRKQVVYFQQHYSRIPGNPDIALPRKKRAVFLDGDFWHGWKFEEKRIKLPKKYWRGKIEKNIRRDKRNRRNLIKKGWKIIRVWEHSILKHEQKTLGKILEFLLAK